MQMSIPGDTMSTVRMLQESDRNVVADFLQQNVYATVFMLGDMRVYGIRGEGINFWGLWEDEDLEAVLMRFSTHWQFFEARPVDLVPLVEIIKREGRTGDISGLDRYVARLLPLLDVSVAGDRTETYMHLPGPLVSREQYPVIGPKRATFEDVSRLVAFYQSAGERPDTYTMSQPDESVLRADIEYNRVWYIAVEGSIVSVALTHAEAGGLGMIGGVQTLPAERARGYSSQVMEALCQDLQAHDLEPVLFWRNPVAGRLYEKLGFREIGRWRFVEFSTYGGV
jgi:hypothetical protein